MFDIAWSEFLVVAVVALVVVGPKDLPALLRTVGKTVASLRRMAGEFQGQFNEAMREAELDDLKNEVTGLKDKASRVVGASPFQIARDEIKNALSGVDKPKDTPSALAGPSDDAATPAIASDTPSAFAPPPPETPAPTESEFRAAEPAPAEKAAKAARTAAATEGAAAPAPTKAVKPASAKKPAAEKKPAAAKTKAAKAEPEKPAAEKAPAKKPAARKASPKKAAAEKAADDQSGPTPPGASA